MGLFAFGIFTKYNINDKLSLIVCIISVIIVIFIGRIPSEYIGGYVIGRSVEKAAPSVKQSIKNVIEKVRKPQ